MWSHQSRPWGKGEVDLSVHRVGLFPHQLLWTLRLPLQILVPPQKCQAFPPLIFASPKRIKGPPLCEVAPLSAWLCRLDSALLPHWHSLHMFCSFWHLFSSTLQGPQTRMCLILILKQLHMVVMSKVLEIIKCWWTLPPYDWMSFGFHSTSVSPSVKWENIHHTGWRED